MTSSRITKSSSKQRTVERCVAGALGDLRKAAAFLKAAESKLLAHLRTPAAAMCDDTGYVPRPARRPRALELVRGQTKRAKPRRGKQG